MLKEIIQHSKIKVKIEYLRYFAQISNSVALIVMEEFYKCT